MSHAFDDVYPIGLGTTRFPLSKPETFEADFENAVDLVLYALKRGVNYIDVGPEYSSGKAFSVLREAFRRTNQAYHVTVKVGVGETGIEFNEYYRRARSILDEMGLERASHFLLWALMDSEQFHRATGKGGLYDVALRLKDEGRIQHIGASVHMRPEEILEVIDSGLFEFILVSCHLINFLDMREMLDRAYEKGVDILVMNPLYGGLIAEKQENFTYAKFWPDESVIQAAIRALLSHPAVKCVLAGASDRQQLDEYLSAVSNPAFDLRDKAARLQAVTQNTMERKTFCSYCQYCANCPQEIPVPQIMNARNIFTLEDGGGDFSLTKTFFRYLNERFDIEFESSENPCIQCGRCEQKCTQHLDIIQSVDKIYQLVGRTCYDNASRRKRLDALLNGKGYRKVGFWPASAGSMKILQIYQKLFGKAPFEVYLFDSNKEYQGRERFGYIVHTGEESAELGIDCILITSFLYGDAIYEQIKSLNEQGIVIKKLYREGDVDWWW